MIGELKLLGYRGFECYRLSGLRRVNLLVGKNNSGKTSVLEAVHLLAANGNPTVLADIAHMRDGKRASTPDARRPSLRTRRRLPIDISSSFFGYLVSPGTSMRLETNEDSLELRISTLTEGHEEHFDHIWSTSFQDEVPEMETYVLKVANGISKNFHSVSVISDSGLLLKTPPRHEIPHPAHESRFLSAESLQASEMRAMWDRAIVESKESKVVRALWPLQQNIEAIHFLTSETPRPEIIVGLMDSKLRVPLSSFGDGVRRFLALSLSLTAQERGMFLVDEIDTGLHWTVMEDLWRLVICAARDGNVQVFATTHSYDCVKGLASLLEREPGLAEEVSLQKLERRLDKAVAFRGEQIPRAVSHNIELR